MFKEEKKNYFILVGCNYEGELCGCTNDAVALYNTFQLVSNSEYFLLKDTEQKITKESIKKIVNNIHLKEKENNVPYQIIFFFAGHGYQGGILRLSNENINCHDLYELFNSESNRKFDLLILLDCCYSGGFNLIKKYGNIREVTIITSCNSSQRSAESISIVKEAIILKEKYEICKNGNYYIGIFTYNLSNILRKLILSNKTFKVEDIFTSSIWSTISMICKQTYQIKK